MGTTDNIFSLHGLISHCNNNNDKPFAAFVDFLKAFDYISQGHNFNKLKYISLEEDKIVPFQQ